MLQLDVDRDQLAAEEDLVFILEDTSPDFWDFVFHNRTAVSPHRPALGTNYSIVYGPVTLYPQTEIVKDADQICFTTQQAANLLEHPIIAVKGTPLIPSR